MHYVTHWRRALTDIEQVSADTNEVIPVLSKTAVQRVQLHHPLS